MPSERFAKLICEQIGHELAASQQYAACAVHYDRETLPRLASFFYRQSLEERNHAMMFVRYLLDQDLQPRFPPLPEARAEFSDVVEPIALALEQERRVTEQIITLARAAREDGDFQAEQFLQWFLKEQSEEVSSMSALLTVARRADNPLWIEEHLAREDGAEQSDPTAPPAAGGAL